MTGEEAKFALLARVPVTFKGIIYERVSAITYQPTQDMYIATTKERITVSLTLVNDSKGSGSVTVLLSDAELLQPIKVKQGPWGIYSTEWQEQKRQEVKRTWEQKYYGNEYIETAI